MSLLTRFLGAQWCAIGFNGVLSFALSVLIARTFGPDLFGVYATAVALGALFSVLVDGGFGKLLQREATRGTPGLAWFSGSIEASAYGHALLMVGLAFVIVISVQPPYHLPTLLFALAASGVGVMGQFGLSILRGRGRFVRDAAWQISSRMSTALCILLVLFLGASQPWQVLGAQFFGAAIFVLFVMAYLQVRPLFSVQLKIYRIVAPLVWLDFATIVYFRSDMLLFKLLELPRADVGYYGVAYRMVEAILLLASPVSLILFRKFRIERGTTEHIVKTTLRPVVAANLMGCALAALFWIFGDRLIALTYGPAFQPAGHLLEILAFCLVFAVTNGVLIQAALAIGIERWCAVSATLAALVSVGGNLVLLPRFGIEAAAWMTVVTEFVLGGGVALGLYLKRQKARSLSIDL